MPGTQNKIFCLAQKWVLKHNQQGYSFHCVAKFLAQLPINYLHIWWFLTVWQHFRHALFAKQKWRKALFNLLLHKSIPPWGQNFSQNEINTRVLIFSSIQTYSFYRAEASFQKHLDKDQLSWLHLALKILLFKNWLVWIQDPFIKWTWPFHRFKLPPTDMVFSYHIYTTTTVCVCSLCAKIIYLNMHFLYMKWF